MDIKCLKSWKKGGRTVVFPEGDSPGEAELLLLRDKSKSTVGGSPRGGREDKLWDMSMSAMEKNTSSKPAQKHNN